MQSSLETLPESRGRHSLGPKPKASKYLNKLMLELSQSIDSKTSNEQSESLSNNKNEPKETITNNKPKQCKRQIVIHKKQHSASTKKIMTDVSKAQRIASTNTISLSRAMVSIRASKERANKRAGSANCRNNKLIKHTGTNTLELFKTIKSSVNTSERNRHKCTEPTRSTSSGKAKVKKSIYLNKLVAQNKIHSNQLPEKSKMVVIDLENAERITWKREYEKNGLTSKLIKKTAIPSLAKVNSDINPYVMYFHLN